MSSFLSLDRMRPGDRAVLIKISESLPSSRRLKELGFLPGAHLSCVLTKKHGETSAYDIKGTTIALRREDASHILVSPIQKGA